MSFRVFLSIAVFLLLLFILAEQAFSAPYTTIREDGTGATQFKAIDHDSLQNYVANEHLDWTLDQDPLDIHLNNIPDLSTVYEVVDATILRSADLNTFAELDALVADVSLLHTGLIDAFAELDALVSDASLLHTGLIDTLFKLNAILTDATLIDTTDSRLSDSRDASGISGKAICGAEAWADGEVASYELTGDCIRLEPPASAPVTSVFGRTGAILAQSGDYNTDQITETVNNKIMTATERNNLATSFGWGDHSTWAGSTNITTLGTITTGVWQGTAILDAYISDTLTLGAASTAATASADDSDTSIATTAFVQQEINGAGGTNLLCSGGQCNVADAFVANSGGDTMEPKLTISDSATTSPLNVTERAVAPSAPASGDIYLDDGTNTTSGNPGWRRYTGVAWEEVSPGGGSLVALDLGDDDSNESTGITEIAVEAGDANSIFTEEAPDKLSINPAADWPKADEADALAANGTNCSAGQWAAGVDAAGAAEGCTVDDDAPDDDSEVPDTLTVSGGTVSASEITLDTGADPTTDGQIRWDTTTERVEVGDDGTGTLEFYPGAHATECASAACDLHASTTAGGAAIQTGIDDDVPESGDFGAAADLESDGSLSAGVVSTTEVAAATLVTEAEGIASNDDDSTIPTSAAVKDYADSAITTHEGVADPHPGYLLQSGASGGQSAYGGTAAGDDLELNSTSHATKGTINLGDTLYVDEDGGNVGIGTTNPDSKLTIDAASITDVLLGIDADASHIGDAVQIDSDGDGTRDDFVIESNGDVGIGTTSPGAKLDLDAGTLNGGENAFGITYTLDDTAGGENIGSLWTITSAGSESYNQRGIKVVMNAGYTGSNQIVPIRVENYSAGTGTSLSSSGFGGNGAVSFNSLGTGSLNVGSHGYAANATVNVGSAGLSSDSEDNHTNYGVRGFAKSTGTGGTAYGGYFSIDATSDNGAALAADNEGTTNDIFHANDNGSTVFVIGDGGNVGIGTASPASGAKLEVDGVIVPDKVTADPCSSGAPEGGLFYNDTSNYMCFCDGTNDVQMHDPTTACF